MKAVNSNELISRLEAQVEEHLAEAIKVYQNLSSDKLIKPAPGGGWSIAQCMEHLNIYGDYYLPKMEKGMEFSKAGPAPMFTSTWLGNYFTRMLDPNTGKKKIKAFRDYIPKADLDGHSVVAKFIQQQETLIQLLRRARQNDLNKVNIPISLSRWIKMRLGDTFRFLIAHNERHLKQANRLLM